MEQRKVYSIDYIIKEEINKNAYGFIYITTNLINRKKYIGQKKFENGSHMNRWVNYLGSGVLLKRAISKYEEKNFVRDIIAIAYNKEELDYLEIDFIKCHNAAENENYYNISDGGHTGNPYAGKTEDELLKIKAKQSKARRGRVLSEEWIENIKKSLHANYKDEEQRRKHAFFGETNPNYGNGDKIRGEKNWFYGKTHTEETKKKISESKIGNKNPVAKKVICINTSDIFETIKEASLKYNLDSSSITKCCKGKIKSCGGYKWMYKEDYDQYIEQTN
jgi:group I intron endonuclease